MKQLAWRDVRMALAMCSLAGFASANAQTATPVEAPATALVAIPTAAVGRVEREPNGMLRRQWPGTYFETAIRGSSAYFRIGKGEVSLRVTVDGAAPVPLVKPAPGLYRIGGLAPGVHRIRVQVASESQSGPTEFGGFFAPAGVSAAVLPARSRQIQCSPRGPARSSSSATLTPSATPTPPQSTSAPTRRSGKPPTRLSECRRLPPPIMTRIIR